MRSVKFILAMVVLGVALIGVGCSKGKTDTPKTQTKQADDHGHDHGTDDDHTGHDH